MSLPETEGPIREWVRQAPLTSALVSDRVYFAAPTQDRPELPCIIAYRVGGLPDTFDHDHPDYIFECWGVNKHEASVLASALASDIMDSQSKSPVNVSGAKVLMGEVNLGPVPSAGLDWAKRYRVDATFHMRSL